MTLDDLTQEEYEIIRAAIYDCAKEHTRDSFAVACSKRGMFADKAAEAFDKLEEPVVPLRWLDVLPEIDSVAGFVSAYNNICTDYLLDTARDEISEKAEVSDDED